MCSALLNELVQTGSFKYEHQGFARYTQQLSVRTVGFAPVEGMVSTITYVDGNFAKCRLKDRVPCVALEVIRRLCTAAIDNDGVCTFRLVNANR